MHRPISPAAARQISPDIDLHVAGGQASGRQTGVNRVEISAASALLALGCLRLSFY